MLAKETDGQIRWALVLLPIIFVGWLILIFLDSDQRWPAWLGRALGMFIYVIYYHGYFCEWKRRGKKA